MSSSALLHRWQIGFVNTLLFTRCVFVGKQSEHAFHIKCFTFPGTFSFQILDQKPVDRTELEPDASSFLASSHRARYPDFTEYTPFFSIVLYRRSGCGVLHSGIALILWASKGTKHSSITRLFQQPSQ